MISNKYKNVPSCSTCVNSRVIVSEKGYHAVCGLSNKTSAKCITCGRGSYMPKELIHEKSI